MQYPSFDQPMDYARMTELLDAMREAYPFLAITSLGCSLRDRRIPLITLGEGKKAVLYVGTHHAMEWVTTSVLLKFIFEFCEVYAKDGLIGSLSLQTLFSARTIYIVPMLNPDGVEYQQHGVAPDDILYDRLMSMNGGCPDFSRWQANARGVDLNHNYNAGFAEYKRLEKDAGILGGAPTRYSGESPESEPETGALCNFMRFRQDIGMVVTLHTQGEEIYTSAGDDAAGERVRALGRSFSFVTGYRLADPEGMAAYGGLTDWCREIKLPAFTFECGLGENPLPAADSFEIYAKIRRALFLAPTWI